MVEQFHLPTFRFRLQCAIELRYNSLYQEKLFFEHFQLANAEEYRQYLHMKMSTHCWQSKKKKINVTLIIYRY